MATLQEKKDLFLKYGCNVDVFIRKNPTVFLLDYHNLEKNLIYFQNNLQERMSEVLEKTPRILSNNYQKIVDRVALIQKIFPIPWYLIARYPSMISMNNTSIIRKIKRYTFIFDGNIKQACAFVVYMPSVIGYSEERIAMAYHILRERGDAIDFKNLSQILFNPRKFIAGRHFSHKTQLMIVKALKKSKGFFVLFLL